MTKLRRQSYHGGTLYCISCSDFTDVLCISGNTVFLYHLYTVIVWIASKDGEGA